MEPHVGGIYERVKNMKAVPMQTFTTTSSIPASLAIGNKYLPR